MSTADLRDIKKLSDTFHRKRGNIAACAAELEVSRDSLHRYIRENPEAARALEEARQFHSDDEVDLAVSVSYQFMLDYKNNPGIASRHVMYTLDRKGHTRGYQKNDSSLDQPQSTELLKELISNSKENHANYQKAQQETGSLDSGSEQAI